jgi:hypothetical protein
MSTPMSHARLPCWHDLSAYKSCPCGRQGARKALRPVFAELAGLSHRAAAKALNERGIKTATGKAWTAVQVIRVRERLADRQ